MNLISGPSGDRQILPGRRPFFPGETEIHHRNHGTTRDDDPTQNRTRVRIYAALWAIPGVFRDRNWFRTPEEHTNPVGPKIWNQYFPPKKSARNPKIPKKKSIIEKFLSGKSTFQTKKMYRQKVILHRFWEKNPNFFQNFSDFFFEKNLENFSKILLKIFWKFFEHFFQIFFWTFFKKIRTIFEISDEPTCQFQKIWNNKRTKMFISESWCTASCWIRSCRGFAGPAPRAHSSYGGDPTVSPGKTGFAGKT